MKHPITLHRWLLSAVTGLALLGASHRAQADFVIAGFDADITGASDQGQWPEGSSSKELSWSDIDSEGNPASGSLSNVLHWTSVPGWKDAKVQLNCAWPGVNSGNYVNLEFDIKVLQGVSTPSGNGNYGSVQVVAVGWPDWGLNNGTPYWWQPIGDATIIATPGWQKVSVSLASAPPTLSALVLNFNGNPPNDPTSTIVYLIDNVRVTSPALPPPTLGKITPATAPGLTLIPGAGSEWQRVMVYPGALGSDFGWFNRGNPVSYSFTIKEFPTVGEFAANVFLIPNAHMQWGVGDTAGDWNSTNLLTFNITANSANPATSWNVAFNAKTNLGGGNPNFNNIVNFNYTQFPTGTWTLTFANNTDFSVTAPNGFTTNNSLPLDVAELVSGNSVGNTGLTPYFGIMPRVTTANIGYPSVFSRIAITGVSTPVDDDFSSAPLNSATWLRLADYTPGIFINTNDISAYLNWNTPNDQGYNSLQAASAVAGPYKEIGADSSRWLLINGTRRGIITKSGLNSALGGAESSAAFFRLVKRVASKLQVLPPGETNAPGTLTGKTGTPATAQIGVNTTITIHSVDTDWFIANSGHTIQLTITPEDPLAFIDPPAALANGTVSILVQFGTPGTYTITATDTTDGSLTAGTSSTITVTE